MAESRAGAVVGRVFVYGTLKRGFYNHQFLSSASLARRLGQGETCEKYHLAVGGDFLVPFLQQPGGAGDKCGEKGDDDATAIAVKSVRGEIYEVDAPTLAMLDRIEGVPHFYKRCEAKVHLRPEAGASTDSSETQVQPEAGASTDSSKTLTCFVYVKTELARDLLQHEPLEAYTQALHHTYVPPPLRPDHELHVDLAEDRAEAVAFDADACYGAEASIWRAFMDALPKEGEQETCALTVLEVGCGTMAPAMQALRSTHSDAKVTCVDVSERRLEAARSKFASQTDAVRFARVNLAQLFTEYSFKSFDGAVCLGVLRSVPEALQFHCLRLLVSLTRGPVLVDWPGDLDVFVRHLRDIDVQCLVSQDVEETQDGAKRQTRVHVLSPCP